MNERTEIPELSVSPLELFFDLVFVFAVTQTVSLIEHDPTVTGVLGGALVFFMLWWAWQQYTWGINGVGNDRFWVRLALIVAMGLSLFMALVVVDAFDEDGRLFGIAYSLVLFVGLALFYAGLSTTEDRRTLLTYLPLAAAGGVVVLIGSFIPSTTWRVAAWVVGMVLELLSAVSGAGNDFKIKSAHFAERHALFVILALGESIVAIGLSAVELGRTSEVGIALGAAFLGAVTIWWLYFGRFAAKAEAALAALPGVERTILARDVYTMGHYPLIFGIVLYAVVAEEVVAHPSDALSDSGRWIFALAVVLITLGLVGAARRAGAPYLWERGVAAVVVVGLGLFASSAGWVIVMLFVAAMVVAMLAEHRRLSAVTGSALAE